MLINNANDRAECDDYEILNNYYFSGAIRGPFSEPKKIPTFMRLDNYINPKKIPYLHT